MATREELIDHIAQTQRELRTLVTQDRTHPLIDVNLTMSQMKILLLLQRSAGASSQDLARSTGVSPATMTGIIDRLVGLDLVRRDEDPQDRRVRRLTLTATGTEVAETVLAAGEHYMARLLQRLDLTALELVAEAFDLILGAVPRPSETITSGTVSPAGS
jgi:DNA-binding MarR family transcriptional regulator